MNISLIPIFLVVFCYCLLYTTASDVDYLRTLDDFIAYRISFKPQEEELKYQEGNEEVIVPIMSADDEQYHCYLPIIEQNVTFKRALGLAYYLVECFRQRNELRLIRDHRRPIFWSRYMTIPLVLIELNHIGRMKCVTAAIFYNIMRTRRQNFERNITLEIMQKFKPTLLVW